MTTDTVNVRSLILDILIAVLEKGGYSHRVIGAVLEKYQYLDKKERAFLTRVSEGTIQRKIELDYITDRFSKIKTEKMKPVIRNLLRMSVYQLRYMDSVPDSAVCNEAVKLAKKRGFTSLGGFVNGVLRSIAGHAGDISYPDETVDPVRAYSVRYSMPEWIVRQWMENYGAARTVSMLEVSLTQAPFTIRTNLTRISSGALRERLESEGISAAIRRCLMHLCFQVWIIRAGWRHLPKVCSTCRISVPWLWRNGQTPGKGITALTSVRRRGERASIWRKSSAVPVMCWPGI